MTTLAAAAATDALLARLNLHSRLRWAGVGLFVVALPGVGIELTRIGLGQAPVGHALVCLGSLLSALSAFGTNNDTAVHAMRELQKVRALPAGFGAELTAERKRRPLQLREAKASPKVALVLPVVATVVSSWLYYRVGVLG